MFAEGLPQARHRLSAGSQQNHVMVNIISRCSLQVSAQFGINSVIGKNCMCLSATMDKKTGILDMVAGQLLKILYPPSVGLSSCIASWVLHHHSFQSVKVRGCWPAITTRPRLLRHTGLGSSYAFPSIPCRLYEHVTSFCPMVCALKQYVNYPVVRPALSNGNRLWPHSSQRISRDRVLYVKRETNLKIFLIFKQLYLLLFSLL